MKKSLVLLFLLAVFAVQAQKQHLQFFHLTEKDGIENLYNPTVIEDKKRGFLWLGTESGLYRYDGEAVLKVYPLPGKTVESLNPYFPFRPFLSDSQGDLWFYDGELSIKRFSAATGLVEKIPVRSAGRQDSVVKFYPVFYQGNVFEDREGRIWANTGSHGLLRLDKKANCFSPAPFLQKLPIPGNSGNICEDAEGWLWFANESLPVRYNPETGEAWFSKHNPQRWPVFDCGSAVYFVDSRQKLWLAEISAKKPGRRLTASATSCGRSTPKTTPWKKRWPA